jgi:hypothetical protein
MVAFPLLPWTTSSAAVESCHIYSLLSLVEQLGHASDQVQGAGYSKSEVEMDAAALELETDTAASGQVMYQKISN